ncbi:MULTISPECIES: dienelactone hydrolase family protein [Micrococcaceae]|uniref:dienelactone hydrolase family protein n=1 Tax=Micrococcaceae TaxID=1268 RepID=UPI0004B7D170|nr:MULTISPECIES: dienelactone hydrolase family protein [Micrococcaceae]BCW59116.1 hypothetical protein StoSoilB20_24630 [Arthrobacter sp. StoSoilB20]
MVQLEKFEKYLIEEFYDDFRTGEMSHKTFTRRVAFIIGEYDRVCGGHDPGGLYTGRGAQRHVDDFKGAFEYLNGQDFVEEGRVAMIGFCFGGGITWQASTEIQGLKATSAFYGPAPDPAKVPTIKPAVFGVYAENDARMTGSMPQLQEALDKTSVKHQLKVYPGVDHAFHNDTSERYVRAQATAAWNDTLAWFRDNV